MRLKSLFKREDGAVAVMVAISMTVLLGFSALAVDYGLMASGKQAMQNAADSAALAAAADIGAGRSSMTVRETALKYCKLNGFDEADENVTVDVIQLGKSVNVKVRKAVPAGFSGVFRGNKKNYISAEAKAEAVTIFGSCPYALFAGQKIEDRGFGIDINGNGITINGNIHSNADISMPHAVLGPGSVATAVRNTNPSTGGWSGGNISLDMPSFSSFEKASQDMYEMVEYMGSVDRNNLNIQTFIGESLELYRQKMGYTAAYRSEGLFIHVYGDLTLRGNSHEQFYLDFPVVLVVDGDITFNGSNLQTSVSSPFSLMSKNGSIVLNGSDTVFTGIIYAPKGDIYLNGNDAVFNGSLVAKNIRKTGGKTTINYVGGLDGALPTTKVHLVE